MKISRKIAAPLAALSLAAGALVSPALAGAATLTPSEVDGGAALATISELNTPITEESPAWRQETVGNERVQHLNVFSPSMGRDIPVAVITAKDNSTPRPTIYMLNGAGGAEQNVDWISSSPILDVYDEENINVVIPMEGAFSYYTDWKETPTGAAYKGKQLWETFLTKELPGPIEKHLDASNERGIGGMSMSATSALVLAQHNPGFYDAVASFSGCAATADPLTNWMADITVQRGGGTTQQMWGPVGGEYNRYNDALINAANLRDTELYISNASGLGGETDMPGYYTAQGVDQTVASIGATTLLVEGGVIEAATNVCTHNLKAKLDSENIDAEWNFRPTGTHSWPYWNEDIEKSVPMFHRAFETND